MSFYSGFRSTSVCRVIIACSLFLTRIKKFNKPIWGPHSGKKEVSPTEERQRKKLQVDHVADHHDRWVVAAAIEARIGATCLIVSKMDTQREKP